MEYKRLTGRDNWCGCVTIKNGTDKDEIWERLAELEDKIENGTLIELPIPYGTELHFLWSRQHASRPQPPRVHSTNEWIFKIRSDGQTWFGSNDIPCGFFGEYLHELGKTVFLTKYEAEKKLEELKNWM